MSKFLQKFKKIIYDGVSTQQFLEKLENANIKDNPILHIIFLHSITEALLRKILKNNLAIGKNIHEYHKKYPESFFKKEMIRKATSLRNKFSHDGFIYNHDKNVEAINIYRKYIKAIADEQKIDLEFFYPFNNNEDKGIYYPKKRFSAFVIIIFTSITLSILFGLYHFFAPTILPIISSTKTILTASATGTYNKFAKDIKKIQPDIEIITTKGSMDNMERIGKSDSSEKPLFAFVQYDVLEHLSKEALKEPLEERNILKNLRVLFPVSYGEIHVLVREGNDEIKSFQDLKGKKISIDSKKSGTYLTAKKLYQELFDEEISPTPYRPFPQLLDALRDGEIDAIMLTGGQPLNKLKKWIDGIKIIPYQREKPIGGYTPCEIKQESYHWLKEKSVQTLCVESFLVTNISQEIDDLKYLKKFIEKMNSLKREVKGLNKKQLNKKELHSKWRDFASFKYLPTLPTNVEYHPFVKWEAREDNLKK
jgi:TRAP transporter TAXI family solute receptor